MNHFLPIPFFLLAVILYIVSKDRKLKLFEIISKIVIIISVLVFIYEYAKYLGYDIFEIIHSLLF